jgi:nucleoside-diphosphate-sugar epimerase
MNNTKQETNIIFGTGPIGLAVMHELLEKKKKVVMVNKRNQVSLPEEVKLIQADATDPRKTSEICKNATVVYNCTNAPYDRWADLLLPLHSSILEGAASAGAKLVVMDNLYMYGEPDGKPLTEDTPHRPTTRKGKIRAHMSEDLFEAHDKGKVRATSGRAADYFGPGAPLSSLGEQVFYPACQGKAATLLGKVDLPHSYTFVPDIGKALVILGEKEEALGQTWHIPSPETMTTREVINLIYQNSGYSPKIRTVPSFLVKLLGLFNSTFREIGEMVYEYEKPFVMDDSKFKQTFGMNPVPMEQAIKETVEWYCSHPK